VFTVTTLDLHLGPRVSWKDYRAGRIDIITNANGTRSVKKVPCVHSQIKVTEKEADGLIQLAKKWEEANRRQRPEGAYNRLIRVSNVKRNIEPDPEPVALGTSIISVMGRTMAEAIGTAVGESIAKAMHGIKKG
jgi:hypothetical protein